MGPHRPRHRVQLQRRLGLRVPQQHDLRADHRHRERYAASAGFFGADVRPQVHPGLRGVGAVNGVVPNGQLPTEGDETSLNQTVTLHPTAALTIANTYIWDRVDHDPIHRSVFNNHIIRSESNYQYNRQLSVRFIAQYNGLLANPQYTSLTTTKDMNFDFLITYLVHPGTAIYVGYNSNLENIDRGLCLHVAGTTECDPNGAGLLRSPFGFINDGKQVFIKVSYLFRR